MVLLDVQAIGSDLFSLDAISFIQQPGERIAIAGETGSGKTSLLKIIAGLLQPDRGTVFFRGKRIWGPHEKLMPGHPRIAYLSQHFELRNNYRVEEELESRNLLSTTAADEIYRLCRIDHLLKRKTTELSGGERQRIALAAWLTRQPDLLLLDEPFSNLDPIHKLTMKGVLRDVQQTLGTSILLVSHDGADTLSWADRIIILQKGRLIQQGTPAELYYSPVNEYAAALFGEFNQPGNELINSLFQETTASRFLRPEQLFFTTKENARLEGEVKEILFFGHYYRALVLVRGQLLIVYTRQTHLQPGDRAYLALSEPA